MGYAWISTLQQRAQSHTPLTAAGRGRQESGEVGSVSARIRDWLETERQPADVYELLGRLRFDPDRQQLLAAVRSAYAELLPYQNHADPRIARRAIQLQRELGNAENILSNADKLQAHHQAILTDLREAYVKTKAGGEDWSRQRLQSWLNQEQRVHAIRVEPVARVLSASGGESLDFEFPETTAVKPVIQRPKREERRHETEASPPVARRRAFDVPSTKTRPQAKAPLPKQPPPPPTPARAQQPLIEQPMARAAEIDAAPLRTIQKRKGQTWSRLLTTKAIPRNKFLRVALTVFIVVGAGLLIGMATLYVTHQLKAAKAEGEWSTALAAADKDLLGKYARQGFDAAREKAASARTQAAEGNPQEATRLFREALVTLNRATSMAIVARNAERAKQEALAAFETTVRFAAYDRGEEMLTEANAAMAQTRFDDAEDLFHQAAKSFAQALAESNELGHAKEAWSAALGTADKDLVGEYLPEALHAAQEKAASAATLVTDGKPEEATTVYRDALVMLHRAGESLIPQLQITISNKDRLAATEVLATIDGLIPKDPRLALLREQVEALPPLAIAPFDAKRAEQYQQAWADSLGVPINTTNSIGMRLVLIPPGEFQMGSPAGDGVASSDEKPHHNVRITKPFYLGVCEVTQEQYERVMAQNPSRFKGDPQRPVGYVSWTGAAEFCRKLSEKEGVTYRLPTEAEWEYACRAGTTTRYYFGDDEASLGEYACCGKTHAVGEKKPNAWGLYDMHGNVWEWCHDWADENYYAVSPTDDPPGPETGSIRSIRGGSIRFVARNCRAADRSGRGALTGWYALGFRVARSPSGR